MPSTTSSWVSRLFASSTVMTPSLPTFSMASAIMSPIVLSPFADTVPTWAISSRPLVDLERRLSSSVTDFTAASMPRLRFIGSWPAATILAPSVKSARASTVAVVVPSPATSEVLDATSFTIWAPMFSNLSENSISFATVTPSLVTFGAPQDFSSTTFRPRGPSVTVTASASTFTPRSIFARASSLNLTILAAMFPLLLSALDDAEDLVLAKDQTLFPVDLDLAARVLAEEDAITRLDVERDRLALVVGLAFPDGQDLPFLRLLLGRVGDDDPAGALLLVLLDALHDQAVVEWTNVDCHVTKTSLPGPTSARHA